MHRKCIFCGSLTREEDGICGTCKFKMEVDNEEDREFQELIEKRIREKANRRTGR